jgi:lysyl-tRNA synthetase class 2
MEPHIRPFQVRSTLNVSSNWFLPTSPEFAMKRLLVGGLEKIFQICPAFRDEPNSPNHRPEFTLLEWYRANANDEDIMQDTEKLLEFLVQKLFGKSSFSFQGKEISVKTPWPRFRIRDLFVHHLNIDLIEKNTPEQLALECRRLGLPAGGPSDIPMSIKETWDDLYFKLWLNFIEPQLPQNQAIFVTRYPASQAALSAIDRDPDGSFWARRFEVYAGGMELGNAFQELTDPIEQRNRFIEDMELRERTYGSSFPKNPIDEEFLEALAEGMPPSGGIAMGVDRIVMLLADEPDIGYTFWL